MPGDADDKEKKNSSPLAEKCNTETEAGCVEWTHGASLASPPVFCSMLLRVSMRRTAMEQIRYFCRDDTPGNLHRFLNIIHLAGFWTTLQRVESWNQFSCMDDDAAPCCHLNALKQLRWWDSRILCTKQIRGTSNKRALSQMGPYTTF